MSDEEGRQDMQEEEEELTAEDLLLKTLPSLMDFAKAHPLYPARALFLYKIYRDLYLSGEYEYLNIIDGSELSLNGYILRGRSVTKKVERTLIPIELDTEVDLQWLEKTAQSCESRKEELYLCVGTLETVIQMPSDPTDYDLQNIEKFLHGAEAAKKAVDENLQRMMRLANGYYEQNRILHDTMSRVKCENTNLRRELKESIDQNLVQSNEIKKLLETIQQLQRDRSTMIDSFKQDLVARVELERFRYEMEMKNARIRQLESENASRLAEMERMRAQLQKHQRQSASSAASSRLLK